METVARLKSMFLDTRAVTDSVDRATRKVLSKFGAFVRTRAKSSIRSRKAASSPGSPPSSHTGILKRFIYFAYDANVQSVIIGPAATNQVFFQGDGQPVTGTVPEILERGGSIRILERQRPDGTWTRADLRSRRRLGGVPIRLRTVTIRPRPYMGPAFEKEKDGLPNLWADAVK